MASMHDDKMEETILVSSNIYLHVEGDGYANFYVYDKSDRGFLLNGTTVKDLLNHFKHDDQIDLVNEVLTTLTTVLNSEVIN